LSGALNVSGTVAATTFSGSGASLTSIGTTSLSATGTANSTTFLRGDNTWSALTTASLPALPNTDIWVGNGSNVAAAVALSGDCTITNAGVITCTKTNGSSFGVFATAASINLASQVGVSVLPVANGGTNSSGQTTNGVAYYNGSALTTGTGFVYNGTNVGIGTATAYYPLDVNGTARATTFTGAHTGNGSGLTSIGTSSLSATGTANSTTFLRGDNTWSSAPASSLTVASTTIASGTTTRVLFDNAGVLGEYTITGTGNVVMSASPTLTGTVTGGTFSGSGASLTNLNASNLSSGTVPTAQLGSGTANSSTYLRGDGTWATGGSGTVAGSGATNYVAKFTSSSAVGSSLLYDSGSAVGISTAAPTSTLTINGTQALQFGTDYSTATSTQSDVAINTASAVRYTGAGSVTFYGIVAGNAGQILYLTNAATSSNTLTLANQSGSESTAANKIITGTGGDMVLDNNSSVVLQYDGAASRWRVIGGPNSSQWTTSGTAIYYNTGNVGVGTAAPQNLLDVNGAASIGYHVAAPTNGLIVLGNVGIGTASPFRAFDVEGGGGFRLGGGSNGNYFEITNGSVYHSIGFDRAIFGGSSNDLSFLSGTNLRFYTSGVAPARMLIDTAGNIGIGTALAYYPLDVNGTARATTFSGAHTGNGSGLTSIGTTSLSATGTANSTTFLRGDNTWSSTPASSLTIASTTIASGTTTRVLYDNSGVLGEYTITGTGNVVMSASPTLTGTITAAASNFSGNVGIGTATPHGSLTISGTSNDQLELGNSGATPNAFIATDGSSLYLDVNRRTVDGTFANASATHDRIMMSTANGAGYISFASSNTNGAQAGEVMRIAGSGNVGIGTTVPNETLEVANTTARAIISDGAGANRRGLLLVGPTASADYGRVEAYGYGTSGAGKILALNASGGGNVGIGTTVPQAKLDAVGSIRAEGNIYVDRSGGSLASYLSINQRAAASAGGFSNALGNGQAEIISVNTAGLIIGSYDANPIAFGTNDAERMRITSGGNVGIGTTVPNPFAAAAYGKDVTVMNATSGARAIVELWSNVAPLSGVITGQINFINGTSPVGPAAAIVSASSGTTAGTGNLVFYTSASAGGLTPQMTIDTAGKVGIGLTATHLLQLNTDDGYKPNGGSWGNSSDERLKTNITPVADALAKIGQLHPVLFDWRNPSLHGGKAASGGFIAQQMMKVFPDFVTKSGCVAEDCKLTDGGKEYGMSLPFTFDAYLVKAVQELKADNDNLRAANDNEAAQIKMLTARLDALEAARR
jgi:hypothetical protein